MSDLNSSSSKAAETLKGLSVGNPAAYVQHMEKMADNVAALNTVYEMQLKSSNDQVKASGDLYDSIAKLVENVSDSVEDTRRYKTEMCSISTTLRIFKQCIWRYVDCYEQEIKEPLVFS